MPEYLAPGVFVEEIDGGSKPIEGVGTNTGAFVGYAKSGEFNKPTFISNWTQFVETFGQDENLFLKALADELAKGAAEVLKLKIASKKSWSAFSAGQARNFRTSKSLEEFYRNHKLPQSSTPYIEGTFLAHAVRGYYDNGGGRAYIVRIPRESDVETYSYVPKVSADPIKATAQIGSISVKAIAAGPGGNDVKVEVSHEGEGYVLKIVPADGGTPEVFGTKDKPLTAETLKTAVKSKVVTIELVGAEAKTLPALGTHTLSGGVAGGNLPSAGDKNALVKIEADDFVGDEANRTGFNGLAPIDDINFIAVPDLMAGVIKRTKIDDKTYVEEVDLSDRKRQEILAAQCALVSYCERMGDRMAIIDSLPGLTPLEMKQTTNGTPYNCDHGQAAIYYPWIKISDPLVKGQQMLVPPSGHVSGVWTRVGVERGVHKAPANEALMGAIALEYQTTKGEQEILNPDGINCIRSFPGTGIRVWGARTLATVGNPSWKYVNVRRLFNYLERSMERGMQWVVFEPNDPDLWGRVRRNLSAFLFTEWKEGKLFGTVPSDAFYVKCDHETNPQEMIDLGRLYVEIGVNPVKPAEFVIIRIGQWSSSSSIAEA